MLIRQKKKVKNIFIVSIFISTIFLSNIYAQFLFDPIIHQNNGLNEENENSLQFSYDLDLLDYEITGIGTSQEVRAFFSNQSESLGNYGSFNISAPANNMKLSYGDFNFTFQNNYTTEYIIEDNSALYPEDHIQVYQFDTNHFNFTTNVGSRQDAYPKSYLVEGVAGNYWTLQSNNGILNFTIEGNFTGAIDPNNNYEPFDRTNILGIINYLACQINESSASLSIRIKNYTDSTWNTVVSNINVSTSGIQYINEIVINENLHYIDLNDQSHVEFVLNKSTTGEFDLQLYEISLKSTMGFELDITNTSYVALEFDLRGASSRVNGFYAWIRTLNLTEAAFKTLNISLYKADTTLARTESNLRTVSIEPNYSLLIDNIMVPYLADNLSYFEFNLENTTDLSYFNYFIVIKSDAPEGVYSLVTIPFNEFGDPEGDTEQQLKTYNDVDGWVNAVTNIGGYTTGQLDASSFKLNITRGYFPSDFNGNLTIQDIGLQNKDIEFYPFVNNDNIYKDEWGKATWSNDFTNTIPGDLNNDFQVNLMWDHVITRGFEFNVSYAVEAYKIESAASTYKVNYDGTPEWNLTYSFNPTLVNWNFIEFWYLYPNTMTPSNLYNTTYGFLDLFSASQIQVFSEDNNYNIYNASSLHVTGSNMGLFKLNLTSFNCVNEMHSYINFNGILWETRGFMYGDNISLSLDLQNTLGLAPTGGNANATLFQDGSEYGDLYSTNGIVSSIDNILYYDFDNQTILDITKSVTLGKKYYIGYFWTNGTEIGCKKMLIYLESYDAIIDDCAYLSYYDMNSLTGTTTYSAYDYYSLLIASVNETTKNPRPGYYPVSNLSVNEDYTYNVPMDPNDLSISLLKFEQSENILNPEEIVNFKLQLKNLDNIFSFNVKVKVQLISYANNDWIINETTSDPIKLEPIGAETGNTAEFGIDIKIPTLDTNTKVWKGLNSPIRMGGARTVCTLYIEFANIYYNVGSYSSSDYSLLVTQKENEFEGHILDLKTREDYGEGGFSQYFERDVCIYNQTGFNSTFVINTYTSSYTSSYNQTIESFSLKLNSKFANINTNPEVIYGDVFNITSILMTEFGSILSGKNVTCQFQNGSSWENISSQITDTNGITNFKINTTTINVGDSFTLRLLWLGNNTIENCSSIIPINKIIQSNNIYFTFSIATLIIYKNSYNSLKVQLTNNGTSTMIINVNSINVDITGSLSTTLYFNTIEMQNLEPGESTNLIIEIFCGDVSFDQININISIEAQNVMSLETVIFKSSIISLKVIAPPFLDNLTWLISILIVAIIIAVWLISIIYTRNTKKKIKASLEKPIQKPKPRRGRYVKVSELKPADQAIDKKRKEPAKKEAEVEEESKQTTDLDSLLEEKGLREKASISKKKPRSLQPKKVDLEREKFNRMKIDRLRRYCKDRKIKISSKDTKSQIIQKILDSKKKKK